MRKHHVREAVIAVSDGKDLIHVSEVEQYLEEISEERGMNPSRIYNRNTISQLIRQAGFTCIDDPRQGRDRGHFRRL